MTVVCSGGGGLFRGGTGGNHGRRRLLVQVSQSVSLRHSLYSPTACHSIAIRVILWGVRGRCIPPLSKVGGMHHFLLITFKRSQRHILTLNCAEMYGRSGLRTPLGSLQHSPRSPSLIKGPAFKGKGRVWKVKWYPHFLAESYAPDSSSRSAQP